VVDDGGRAERGIKGVEAADADAVHPVEIEIDALLGDVAVHPVPPDAGAGGVGWVEKALGKRVWCCRSLRGRGGCEEQEGDGCEQTAESEIHEGPFWFRPVEQG